MIHWQAMLERVTRILFGLTCHQDPSILMRIEGRTVWLCPRSMGLHLGSLFSYLLLSLSANRKVQIIGHASRIILALCISSMAIDWGLGGRLGCFQSTTSTRLLTGMICGSSLSILFLSYRNMHSRIQMRSPLRLSGLHVAGMHGLSLGAGLCVVGSGNWTLVSSILLVSVLAKALMGVHTIGVILFMKEHPL